MRSVKVLYMQRKVESAIWQETVVPAIDKRHDLAIYDESKPLAPQFAAVEAVLDIGGSTGTRQMYDAATDTKFWQVLGAGLDHVDVAYMKSKGFMVSNCPGHLSCVPLGECAMMYVLMLSRGFHQTQQNFAKRIMYKPMGSELIGATLGIIGFGASGQQFARRAKAFGMKIMVIDVRPIEDEILAEIQPDFMGSPDDLDRVIAQSDYLSLHLHLNDQTKHILDARRIGLMKPTACIINVARGALVDEEAMYQALRDGKIGGAGLDVFATEPAYPTLDVYKLPNVVVTPHTASSTLGTVKRRAEVAAENVNRIAQGLEPIYRVDV